MIGPLELQNIYRVWSYSSEKLSRKLDKRHYIQYMVPKPTIWKTKHNLKRQSWKFAQKRSIKLAHYWLSLAWNRTATDINCQPCTVDMNSQVGIFFGNMNGVGTNQMHSSSTRINTAKAVQMITRNSRVRAKREIPTTVDTVKNGRKYSDGFGGYWFKGMAERVSLGCKYHI